MIEVHRLDGTRLVVNAELIEVVETTPDTIISLTNGKKLVVRETAGDIVTRVVAYKRAIVQCRPIVAVPAADTAPERLSE